MQYYISFNHAVIWKYFALESYHCVIEFAIKSTQTKEIRKLKKFLIRIY